MKHFLTLLFVLWAIAAVVTFVRPRAVVDNYPTELGALD